MMGKKAKLPRQVREEREKASVREYFDHMTSGVVVEIGANEPTDASSQSWHLEDKLGWRAILVEPNPELAARARTQRPKAQVFECACGAAAAELTLYIPLRPDGGEISSHAAIGRNLDSHHYWRFREVQVRGRPLDEILEEAGVGHIDLLSIDVEGAEMEVLQGFDIAKYRPRLILLEDKHYHLRKHRYLRRQEYRLCKRTGLNCWYVPKDAKRPPQGPMEKAKLFKRLYISLWWRKLTHLLRAGYGPNHP